MRPRSKSCDRLAANPNDVRKPRDVLGSPYGELREHTDQAVEVCQRATEASPNEPRYRYQLARASQVKDPQKALTEHTELAAIGYPAAFDNLGWLYLDRRVGKQDAAAAESYFRRGSELGDPDCMVSLAKLMAAGEIAGSAQEAFAWYGRAARLGHKEAIEFLTNLQSRQPAPLDSAAQNELAQRLFFQGLGGIMGRIR